MMKLFSMLMLFTLPARAGDTQKVLQAFVNAEKLDEVLQDSAGGKPARLVMISNGLFDHKQDLTWKGQKVVLLSSAPASDKSACLDIKDLQIGKSKASVSANTDNGKLKVDLLFSDGQWTVRNFYFHKKRKMVWDSNF